MIKVGISGGIGSGKTTVCNIFESMGIPVYYADQRAKKIMTSSKKVKNEITNLLGKDAYFKNGRLNRKYIAAKVFNNKNLLGKLNAIVHPAVANESEKWFESLNTKYAIKEAALLIESGSYKYLDYIIIVTAPEKIRIERVMMRDGIDKSQVKVRINNQMSEKEKIKYADFIIDNDGRKSILRQIQRIHKKLINPK